MALVVEQCWRLRPTGWASVAWGWRNWGLGELLPLKLALLLMCCRRRCAAAVDALSCLTPGLLCCASLQVGFRHAEIRGRQLLHNGQPVMLKGTAGWLPL